MSDIKEVKVDLVNPKEFQAVMGRRRTRKQKAGDVQLEKNVVETSENKVTATATVAPAPVPAPAPAPASAVPPVPVAPVAPALPTVAPAPPAVRVSPAMPDIPIVRAAGTAGTAVPAPSLPVKGGAVQFHAKKRTKLVPRFLGKKAVATTLKHTAPTMATPATPVPPTPHTPASLPNLPPPEKVDPTKKPGATTFKKRRQFVARKINLTIKSSENSKHQRQSVEKKVSSMPIEKVKELLLAKGVLKEKKKKFFPPESMMRQMLKDFLMLHI